MDETKRQDAVADEITKLNHLEGQLWDEYDNGGLTTAQKVSVLSEVRKVIYLRALLLGIVPTLDAAANEH
jgi:hypothetical protein